MAPPQFKVIIAGGGIVGLSLGVMLERAGIDYLILEATSDVRPLGGVVMLGPPVLRAFEQLGLLEDLVRQSNIMTGVTVLDSKLNQICRINADYARDRYGYDSLTIVRPKLYAILLSRIPAYKILFAKRVISTAQNSEGVKVRCQDGSTYSGDILVASDGGASPIRGAIYREIKRRSKKTPYPGDYAQPKMDQRCIVGVSEPLSTKQYPILASKNCELLLLMPKETNCMIWFIPMAERRFGWGITSPLPSSAADSKIYENQASFAGARDSGESGIELPGSPASIHGMTQSFSAISTASQSPSSSASSSSPGGDMSDYIGKYYPPNNTSNSAPFTPSHSIKKRQSFSKLSKHSATSTGSSQKTFQQYPTVLQLNESSSLDLKELPNDRVWDKLDEKFHIDEFIKEQPCPYGGTFGDIIEQTTRKMITTVVVEEKFYHMWHFGRTVLLGDACHKLLPSSGHGTTQAILDAISLASLLAELPSNSPSDIEALFRVHYGRRAPGAKAAVIVSKKQDQLLFNRKMTGKIMRKLASSWVSEWMNITMCDRLFESRPTLPFLKPVPDRGTSKNKDKSVPLLQDKRYEMARRKSVSSGYSSGGSGGKHHDLWSPDLDFEAHNFSLSMPSILMLPAVPSLPTTRAMDLEGMVPPRVSSRPGERQYDGPGMPWNPYMDSPYV
ncbi:hypothetical protein BC939DRAFT_440977 [Gamsiella multidivaricata]|uniref:uncharacterized protein n=1 Tax=Gamsiella multidivaricata TaxID=101098 RepID=UPI00221F9D52|nr:uncharacterized protein BC939DRAFT_440977 [Gamsiella multidivaricata]KAG0366323.1 hypothetical protein BGZ54_005528 [Gamsiella multidivaricata]KAI7829519.1 hypothetical protein BC939DRAFT_440977 [Gamsiella multidivaricata]